MRIIIHIGLHKTGTSSLQYFLNKNKNELKEAGYIYETNKKNTWINHNPLAFSFWNTDTCIDGENYLFNLIDGCGNKNIIISSEMLCDSRTDVKRLLKCFKGFDVNVYAYIRHPCDMIVSAFNEVVRDPDIKWTRPINEEPYAYDPSQYDMLKHWFNEIPVILAPYDSRQWKKNSIYHDFLSMIDIESGDFNYNIERKNESISYDMAEILRIINNTNINDLERLKIINIMNKFENKNKTYPISYELSEIFIGKISKVLDIYRPYYRNGFSENFLLEKRGF